MDKVSVNIFESYFVLFLGAQSWDEEPDETSTAASLLPLLPVLPLEVPPRIITLFSEEKVKLPHPWGIYSQQN